MTTAYLVAIFKDDGLAEKMERTWSADGRLPVKLSRSTASELTVSSTGDRLTAGTIPELLEEVGIEPGVAQVYADGIRHGETILLVEGATQEDATTALQAGALEAVITTAVPRKKPTIVAEGSVPHEPLFDRDRI